MAVVAILGGILLVARAAAPYLAVLRHTASALTDRGPVGAPGMG
jgi:hypothetical protein